MEIFFRKSARRHKIGRARALYVIIHYAPIIVASSDLVSENLEWNGKDDRGFPLEIIGKFEEGNLIIFHVMPYDFRRRYK